MRVCHNLSADFDDPNLVASTGLVMALADQAGLAALVAEHVSVPDAAGTNTDPKVGTLRPRRTRGPLR